jgi:hypothetical protein
LIILTSKRGTFQCSIPLYVFIIIAANARYEVKPIEGFDNVLVVDGVPVIEKNKLDILLTKISKDFGKKGAPIKSDAMSMPWDTASGKSKGWVPMLGHVNVNSLQLIGFLLGTFSWSLEIRMKPHSLWLPCRGFPLIKNIPSSLIASLTLSDSPIWIQCMLIRSQKSTNLVCVFVMNILLYPS